MDKSYKAIVERYFKPNYPVKIKKHLTGQGLNEKNNFVLGCRAYDTEPENLVHEMCHLAEREIPKLLEKPSNGWGFYLGKYYKIGVHWGFEPQNDKAVKREARVWAFQYNVLQSVGLDTTIDDLVSSAPYLSSFFLYRGENDKERLSYLKDEVMELTNTYTLVKFEADWVERMKILSQDIP